jgi:membrane peptidoglycan carboxypeptidase
VPLTGPDGAPLPTGTACTPEAVRPDVATTLNQILIGDTALPIGTGTQAAIPGHQIAGKTGTSQDRFSVAFVGYTPQYAASVMVLNPKQNQDLGGYGGGLAAPVWRAAMEPILSAQPPVPFPPAGIPLTPPAPAPPLQLAPAPEVPVPDDGFPQAEDFPVSPFEIPGFPFDLGN